VAQIQWFPGHMVTARRQVEEKIGLVDIIFELLDARIPKSSANPVIQTIIKKKPRLIILNKADLADPKELMKWLHYYKKQGLHAVTINSIEGDSYRKVFPECEKILAELREKEITKGMLPRAYRAMVVGIPNVGKSAFINRLANRNAAKVGDKPGVTKSQQYIKVGDKLELLDNPGILWPKFDDPSVGMKLSLVGSIKDEILPLEEIVAYGIRYISTNYPGLIEKRYNIHPVDPDHLLVVYDEIGRNRGCLLPGNEVDYERVMKIFLDDLRHQKIGNISFEKVEETHV
jgi:ribosome biogenesis GTPase A